MAPSVPHGSPREAWKRLNESGTIRRAPLQSDSHAEDLGAGMRGEGSGVKSSQPTTGAHLAGEAEILAPVLT